jgi:hypothetical protein
MQFWLHIVLYIMKNHFFRFKKNYMTFDYCQVGEYYKYQRSILNKRQRSLKGLPKTYLQ